MDKFKRKTLFSDEGNRDKDLLEFQAVEWWTCDESDESTSDETSGSEEQTEKYVIRCFGTDEVGVSYSCKIKNFTPFYFIKVDDNFSRVKLVHFMSYIQNQKTMYKFKENIMVSKCKIVEKKDIYGFTNGKTFKFVRLVFDNYAAMMRSRYVFKRPIKIPGVNSGITKYKLYESNFEPFMRFSHLKNIQLAGWISVKRKDAMFIDEANTMVSFEVDWNKVVRSENQGRVANFLQASWDIETYSYDRTFPDPEKKVLQRDGSVTYPNQIIQIATTYKYYKSKDFLVKHLLTLKDCAPINDPNVIVECCQTERELILKWVGAIKKSDPDIMYTYNGDSFDCQYLMKRAKLLGIEKRVMSELSRLRDISCIMKDEFFSSSAYGDNEYHRLYVPGRLNYDLLIHMKRGMKKYPSYKLNYIANEIIGEGKLDLSAKTMFDYFDIGTPEKIREIGEYCIVDTALLQQIVDKQLILLNIIQLANVTSVPIGYLTTKGQTIKVYSQILKKAREMNFLVPHTNFNEEILTIKVSTKDPHGFTDNDLQKYVVLKSSKTVPKIDGKYRLVSIEDDFTVNLLTDIELEKESLFGSLRGANGIDLQTTRISAPESDENSFTGATVLEPTPGTYFDDVAVEDFASLYPTIMMAYNLCFSTYVFEPDTSPWMKCTNTKYERLQWDDNVEHKLRATCEGIGKSGLKKGQVCGKQAYFMIEENGKPVHYCRIHDTMKKERGNEEKIMKRPVSYDYTIVQPSLDETTGEKINVGVIPALLDELYSERKKVKRLMMKAAEDGDKLLEDIYNSTQLAIKVSLNSTYGFLGRSQGNLVLKPLASIVTAMGRKMIDQSKIYAEGPFVDFVRENNLCMHTIKVRKISDLTESEKDSILKRACRR